MIDFSIFKQESDGTWSLHSIFQGASVSDAVAHLVELTADGDEYTAEFQENAQTIVVKL